MVTDVHFQVLVLVQKIPFAAVSICRYVMIVCNLSCVKPVLKHKLEINTLQKLAENSHCSTEKALYIVFMKYVYPCRYLHRHPTSRCYFNNISSHYKKVVSLCYWGRVILRGY